MELKSTRIQLIELSANDLDEVHRLHSYPEVDEFNTLGIPTDEHETEKFILQVLYDQAKEPRNSYTWKIQLLDSKKFIGLVGLRLSLDKFRLGEIYYKLIPSYWGFGYATEVAKLLIKVGFERFNLHKVEAGVATQNIASIRVLEKSGMTREGCRRKILPIRGKWVDNYHYAIVEDDPRSN